MISCVCMPVSWPTGDLQANALLRLVLCSPIYTEHANNAADVRGPGDVLNIYLEAAHGDFSHPLQTASKYPEDVGTFGPVGLCSEFGMFNPKTGEVWTHLGSIFWFGNPWHAPSDAPDPLRVLFDGVAYTWVVW